LKTAIILFLSVLLASVASAEVYRWEDADGMHFTDNYSSVPEKYREKDIAETDAPSGHTTPHVGVGINRQYRPVANQENKAAVHQANLEQHRRAAQAKKQQQIDTSNFQNTLQSLVKFIVIWIMLGISLFVIWICTIVDIARSEFITPSTKTVWMLLVLLLPLLGMVPYMILGSHQKCIQ